MLSHQVAYNLFHLDRIIFCLWGSDTANDYSLDKECIDKEHITNTEEYYKSVGVQPPSQPLSSSLHIQHDAQPDQKTC